MSIKKKRKQIIFSGCFMKHFEALGQHHTPCLIAHYRHRYFFFWTFAVCSGLRFFIKIPIHHQHKLSEEGLVFIAIGGTLVSVFGTLNSEAELHFTFNVLLKQ